MEIRLNGEFKIGSENKSFSAWVTRPKGKEVLVLNLGECKITIYPYDRNQIRSLGEKLILLSDT
jgi:hypothetical protein